MPLGVVMLSAVTMTVAVAAAGGYVGLARYRLQVAADTAISANLSGTGSE